MIEYTGTSVLDYVRAAISPEVVTRLVEKYERSALLPDDPLQRASVLYYAALRAASGKPKDATARVALGMAAAEYNRKLAELGLPPVATMNPLEAP